MTWTTNRKPARDRCQRIERFVGPRLAEAKLVAGHLRRPKYHVALVVFLPVKGNDTVRLLHLVPGQGAWIRRQHRIGTGVVFGVDVESDGFVENRSVVTVEAIHEETEHHDPV